MGNNTSDNSSQKNDGMSKEKNNQDYNKKQPNPKDPFQNKNHQIGEDDEEGNQERQIYAQAANTQKGGQTGNTAKKNEQHKIEPSKNSSTEKNNNVDNKSSNTAEKQGSKK